MPIFGRSTKHCQIQGLNWLVKWLLLRSDYYYSIDKDYNCKSGEKMRRTCCEIVFEEGVIADVEFSRDAACGRLSTYHCALCDPRHGIASDSKQREGGIFCLFLVCRRNTINHFCFVWLRIFPRYGKYWFLLAKARKNAVFFHNSGKFWVKQTIMIYCQIWWTDVDGKKKSHLL